MGQELNSDFYNSVFKDGGSEQTYFRHYSDTPWYPVWTHIITYIKSNQFQNILDLGCGPGQFSRYLKDSLPNIKYTGFDFSEIAIDMAKKLTPEFSFQVEDAVTFDYSSIVYDLVIATEFFEHIEGDLDILKKIKSGTTILITLPNMDSEGHVRFLSKDDFTARHDIKERYSDYCEILDIFHFPYAANPENADYLIIMIKK